LDILGEFYETNLVTQANRKQQFFTPWSLCVLMAHITCTRKPRKSENVLRMLDPCCGSGRMVLAASRELGSHYRYYGIDIDPICARMAALNFFLSGMTGEVMIADALNPVCAASLQYDFRNVQIVCK
jgi:type I restriction enzyme M protein